MMYNVIILGIGLLDIAWSGFKSNDHGQAAFMQSDVEESSNEP